MRSSDERCAFDERARQSRLSIALVDRAARSTIAPRDLIDRDRRSRRSIDDRNRRSDERRDLGSLFSLSLSLFPEMI